jgi:type I restriction enzyme S subunit
MTGRLLRNKSFEHRTYVRSECVVVHTTRAKFGGLSNMAAGFPLAVNDIPIRTAEALYQSCRFPHLPEIQHLIIRQASPMTAKMKSKPFRPHSRPDWERVRVKIMGWCLRVKLCQNWEGFSELLIGTGDRPIVEFSRKDDFWGAKPVAADLLCGTNALGRMLMALRDEVKHEGRCRFIEVERPRLSYFRLYGKEIGVVSSCSDAFSSPPSGTRFARTAAAPLPTFFGPPKGREGASR